MLFFNIYAKQASWWFIKGASVQMEKYVINYKGKYIITRYDILVLPYKPSKQQEHILIPNGKKVPLQVNIFFSNMKCFTIHKINLNKFLWCAVRNNLLCARRYFSYWTFLALIIWKRNNFLISSSFFLIVEEFDVINIRLF